MKDGRKTCNCPYPACDTEDRDTEDELDLDEMTLETPEDNSDLGRGNTNLSSNPQNSPSSNM